ncbi:MAG TPA: chemotaxis-specific protein-glutamate methyltransferase CheB [Gemmataceae bacterium]|nr:chemotaxis-specific protein-glutamate methyltransferase CheB [Gemmataceae bacterium]
MRVAIVNDSALATEALRRVVGADPRCAVAWTARDGAEAVRRCAEDRPDVVLMDLLMPVMNGAEATRQIMQRSPCPVLVVTSTVAGNFDLVCQALSHGAYDAVCTPVLGGAGPGRAGAELLAKLDRVGRVNRHLTGCDTTETAPAARPSGQVAGGPPPLPLVAIGASTGGPAALEAILTRWPATFPAAVVIAQHIAPDFAGSLADWLGRRAPLTVRLAAAGDRPKAGEVLIANGADHLVLAPERAWAYCAEPRECPYQPSVDALFHSLAAHWPWPAVAVLLTGIGRDGAEGLLALRQKGWHTVAQDEATSVVYGMPQAANRIGAARSVLPLDQIGSHVAERLGRPV